MTPPWILRAWPPVPGDNDQPSAGQTFWGSAFGDGEAGVAWDWVQVMPGILAIADPMCMVTNLRLLSPEGAVLTAWEAARHLNEIVHALPWQDEVRRVLSARIRTPSVQPLVTQ